MTSKSRRRRFDVGLVRASFATTCAQVKARTEEEAIRLALQEAQDLQEGDWELGLRPMQFATLFVIDPTKDPEFKNWRDKEDYNSFLMEREDDYEFVFLIADCEPGQGGIGPIPHVLSTNDLLLADLAKDWSQQLKGVREASFARYLDFITALAGKDDDSDPGKEE